MFPGQRERISGYHAYRTEQYIRREIAIYFVLEVKISGHPIVHDPDTLDRPVTV